MNLLADGTKVDSKTVTASDGWAWSFTGLPKYRDEGTEIKYTITEDQVAGYASAVDGYDVTNSYIPETVDVEGGKTWNDSDDQDGLRPSSITVNLLADGTKVDSKTVTASDGWAWSFTGLPKYRDHGTEIVYTITEDQVAGYGAPEIDGYDVTNSYIPETVEVSGTKSWDDALNQDGKRPASITVDLLADGTKVDSKTVAGGRAAESWDYSFTGLPKYRDHGTEIVYTVVEQPLTGTDYTSEQDGYNFTNMFIPETVEIGGTKVWNDDGNRDGKRPTSVTVNLLADGTKVDSKTVTGDSTAASWDYSFTGLPKYRDQGVEIVYTVTEDAVEGYATNVQGTTITNSYKPEETEITIQKIWSDDGNRDKIRPETVTVHLLADGKEVQNATFAAGEGDSANVWSYTFTGLPVKDNGKTIVYTVTEDTIEKYTTAIDGFTITNSYKPETTKVEGTKAWSDGGNRDGKRPTSVIVNLLADGEFYDSTTVTGDSTAASWDYSFTDLPKNKDGVEIVYTVEEVAVGVTDYSSSVDGTVITNSYIPETVEVAGTKTWDDAHNQDGLRPSSITVNLLADNTKIDSKTVTGDMTAESWNYSFTGLPKYRDQGIAIVYTVEEEPLNVEGYTASKSDYNFTNKYIPETTERTVKKTWLDGDDQDGIRPASITATLYADNVQYGEPVTLSGSSKDWEYTWTDLPKYRDQGTEIVYRIEETVNADGYEKGSVPVANSVFLTNMSIPETVNVSGSKIWDDADDQDGIRPASITVNLLADGTKIDSKTVTEADGWAYSFTDLPKYRDHGIAIVYTVTEDAVEGYRTTADESGLIFTNKHIPDTTELMVTKAWDDAYDGTENFDHLRPGSVQVQVFANGEPTSHILTLSAPTWTATVGDLPVNAGGKAITYTVKEVGEVKGYTTAAATGSLEEGFTITNKHEVKFTSVSGTKTWDDANDQDGKRPESITFTLLADGETVDTQTVTSEPWSYAFENLPMYNDEGKLITYTVTEEAVEGYTGTVDESGLNFKNSYLPEYTDVKVTKTWDDADNQDGIRPDSIAVQLKANGEGVGRPVTLPQNGVWEYTWTDLPVFEGGDAIVYTVEESVVADYEARLVKRTAHDLELVNKHTPDTVDLSVDKAWVDAYEGVENYDRLRPDSVTVTLLANGEPVSIGGVSSVTLSDDNNWHYEWKDLPAKAAGQTIVYTLTEDEVANYSTDIVRDGDTFTVTNTHEVVPVEVSGTKTWSDANDQDGLRPESITVNLLANGSQVKSATVTPDEDGNWAYAFTDLPRYADKAEIAYTVEEVSVNGYTTEADEAGLNFTNTHIPATIDVSGSKTWNDANDQDGKRPSSITVNLLADGTQIDSTSVSADENGAWSYSFTGLPKYRDHGTEIIYTVTETVDEQTDAAYDGNVNGFAITNTHIPETVEISGTKTWDDADNQDGKRPASVTVNLLANGEKIDSRTVTSATDWSYSFTDLPKYEDGVEISYTVTEDEVADYQTVIDGTAITNSYTPGKVSVNGTKTWNDANNQDGLRPASITVRLFADGEQIDSKTVTAADNWAYSFTDLPEYKGGAKIVYTVTEDTVSGYTTTTDETGLNFINTHTPATTEVSGAKTWHDSNNQDGKRPESITVRLLADGTEVASTEVTADDDWAYSFTDLPKNKAGKEIKYTVIEDRVSDYTTTIDGFDITNTHEPEVTKATVKKKWLDAFNQDGIRPAELKVSLSTGEVVTLNADNNWEATIENLPKYKNGSDEIAYTWTEEGLPEGYLLTVVHRNGTITTLTNQHTPKKTSATVKKIWDDADNQDGKRPESLTVVLSNGVEYTLNAANNWTVRATNLPMYANGQPIVYTWTESEAGLPEGYTLSDTSANGTVTTLTNSYAPELTSATVKKVWDDDGDRDGKRPDELKVRLSNGDEYTLNAANGWTATATGLPKYVDGSEVVYTWTELTEGLPEGYTLTDTSVNGTVTTITNSYAPEKTSIVVSKKWSDDNDRDGIRPNSVLLTLYADGEAVSTQSVDAAGNWSYTFDDLPKYRAGIPIAYRVAEQKIPAGYEAATDESGLTVLNTHIPETVNVSGKKTWVDGNDRDGDRPTSITVNLLADGKKIDSQTVTGDNGWAWEFTGLDKYRDHGTEIVYTVEEEAVDDYEASVSGYDITNTHIGKAKVEFKALKKLKSIGRKLNPGEFSFELIENGKVIQTVSNGGDAYARFDAIEYTADNAGTHTYTIREVEGDLSGVTYDTTEHTFSVNVVDNHDGTIDAFYVGYDPNAGVEFNNTFTPSGSVELSATKNLTGKDLEAGDYSFQIADKQGNVYETVTNNADGTVTFKPLQFKSAGTYEYVISEVMPAGAQPLGPLTVYDGVAYDTNGIDVVIVATEKTDGTLSFAITYDGVAVEDGGEAVFENVTVPATHYPLTATKQITGRAFKPGDKFTFTVEAEKDAPQPENPEVTIEPASGKTYDVDFGDIEFTTDDLGKTYTYTISEANAGESTEGLLNDPFAHWVKLTVVDAGDGTLGVNATYKDNADALVFTNEYSASAEAVLTATKVLEGRDLAEGEFFFELRGDKLPGDVNVLHATNAADGSVTFAPITFTQDDAGKDFKYTISETKGTLGGVTYDENSYDVTISVVDNGDGTLGLSYDWGNADTAPTFVNTYTASPATAKITAHKALEGGKLTDGQFSFILSGTSANAASTRLSATNNAKGIVEFDELTYDEPGVYEYRLVENVPDGSIDNGDGTYTGPDGIVYDGTVHTVVVTVTDGEHGSLVADVAYDDDQDGVSFGNVLQARAGFEFNKYFFGGVGTFNFTLTAADASGNPRAGGARDYSDELEIADDGTSAFTATVQNGPFDSGTATVVFPKITYTADGDYYYLVAEDESTTPGMVADEAVYFMHVKVAGGVASDPECNIILNGRDLGPTDDLSFYNNSSVTLGYADMSAASSEGFGQRVSVYPKATKYLNDTTDMLVGGEFAFELVEQSSGQLVAQATNDDRGEVAFFDENSEPGLAFDEPGTYYYTMREVAGDEAGMTYDDSPILLTVNVIQTDNGLVAETTYNGPGGSEPAFYNVKEGMDITVRKVSRYGGEGLVDCTYALWMVGPSGDVMIAEAVSDASGYITFRDVALLAGQKYYFKEVEAPAGHTVDPYRTAYFSLNAAGDKLVLVEETAADGWHSATENIELDRAKGLVG